MQLSELSVALRTKHDQWWKALAAGEWVWAAYYANDMESLTRLITDLTHKEVENHHADPKSALRRNPGTLQPPTGSD